MYARANESRANKAHPQNESSRSFSRPSVPAHRPPVHPLLELQRTIGNQATERLLRARLEGDPSVPPEVHAVPPSPGKLLDPAARSLMESRFGHDFSKVRIHADERAAESAKSVNARAYTIGQHVVFGRGQYSPETTEGKRLLAHELTHVVQQRAVAYTTSTSLPDEQEAVNERIAEAGANAALYGRIANNVQPLVGTQPVLQRQREGTPQATVAEVEESRLRAEANLFDYANALDHVNAFFGNKQLIHDSLYDMSHLAIESFTDVAGIPADTLGANMAYQLIRIALGVLPGASSVIALFEKLERGNPLAVDAASLAKIASRTASVAGVVAQRTAAGIFTASMAPDVGSRIAATAQRDILSKFKTEGTKKINYEWNQTRELVKVIGANPENRGKMYEIFVSHLGPVEEYDDVFMENYRRQYELEMYKALYMRRAQILESRSTTYSIYDPYFRRTTTAEGVSGIPEAVESRLVQLSGELGGPRTLRDVVRDWGLHRWVVEQETALPPEW